MMITLQTIGHSLYSWLFGLGGLSLVIGVVALVIWWFTPPFLSNPEARGVVFNVGLGAIAFAFVSAYYFTSGYNKAISGVVQNTKEVRDDMLKAVTNVEQCDFHHGSWNTTTGVCE